MNIVLKMERAVPFHQTDTIQTFLKKCVSQPPAISQKSYFNQLEEYVSDSMREMSKDFACLICQGLTFDPRTCVACGTLFCESCLVQWLMTKKSCPKCRSTKNEYRMLTRVE
jgi:hypothetical protein